MALVITAGCARSQEAAIIGDVPDPHRASTIEGRLDPPAGFTRVAVAPASFGAFLRELPLKPASAPVHLHDGSLKHRQDVHAAVIDMSVGTRDLQQCADAVMRVRAEYLFAVGRQDEIAFHFTNGFLAEWKRWRNGERIEVKGTTCRWRHMAEADASHAELLRFLELVFTYAGTLSLEQELTPAEGSELRIGDVFIRGGSPGHAMIVVDLARDRENRTVFLLAQSYMPAQEIHVVRNTADPELGAWFSMEGERLDTPEWDFEWIERRLWP